MCAEALRIWDSGKEWDKAWLREKRVFLPD